jgi:hypothetical protein
MPFDVTREPGNKRNVQQDEGGKEKAPADTQNDVRVGRPGNIKPKTDISNPIRRNNEAAAIGMIQILERALLTPAWRTFLHLTRGFFRRVTEAQAGTKKILYPIPPPVSVSAMKSNKKPVAPPFPRISRTDQRATGTLNNMATIPVTSRHRGLTTPPPSSQ